MFKRVLSVITASLLTIVFLPATSLAAVDRHEVIVVGDEDEWVLELQKKLNEKNYLEFPPTGYFGTDTQNAVVKFQKDNDLVADGKAGPETREALLEGDYADIPDTRVVKGYVKTSTSYSDDSLTVTNELVAETVTPSSGSSQNSAGSSGNQDNNALFPGDKGDAISKLQTRLKELQYYEYPTITGYYGPVTQEAVKKFQRTHGLTEDGIMGESTTQLLFSDSANYYMMYPGDSGEDIQKMQQRLKDLGYFDTDPTGYYGDATVNAVKAFQDNNGLTVDGKAGQQTRSILYSGSAKPANGNSGTSTPPTSPSAPVESTEPTPAPEQDSSGTEPETPPAQTGESAENNGQQPDPEPTPDPEPVPDPEPAPPSNATGVDKVLEIAHSQVGKPYSYGSNGPNSFDCSGFVYYSLKNSGIAVSRLSSASYATLSSWTTISDSGSLAVGDLVFFKSDSSSTISHMGIYLGGGSFIHAAPSSGGVAVSSMSSGYYLRNYVTAKRIF